MNAAVSAFPAGERLRFRLPALTDAAFYRKMMNEPDYHRFIADHGIGTDEDAAAYIRTRSLAGFEAHGFGLWLLELTETGQPVGICGLVVREELKIPDLGYAMLKDYHGQGLGHEAGLAVLDFARAELKLPSLCAITHPDNIRSAALLLKLGFTPQGQRHLKSIGETSDYYVWKAGMTGEGSV